MEDNKQIDRLPTVRVVAAIIERDGLYYATRRGEGEHAGKWEFPGGKIEPGESAEEALHREIREELEIEIEITGRLGMVEYDYPRFHLSMDCFLCSASAEATPLLMVHSAAAWVSGKQMKRMDFLPADKDLVASLCRKSAKQE